MKQFGFKRVFALLLAMVLALSACAQQPTPSQAPTDAPTSAPTTAPTAAPTEAPTEAQPTLPEDLPALDSMSASLTAVAADFAAPDDKFSGTVISSFYHPGGMLPALEKVEAEELDEEGVAAIDRAMRAYTNTTNVEIINRAEHYWLYDHCSDNQRTIYDALYVLAQDPTSTDYYVTFQSAVAPSDDQLIMDVLVAWLCIGDDHPELWWIYFWNGTTGLNLAYQTEPQNGMYTYYLYYTAPYPTFEQDVAAFNAAVEDFLSTIDKNADEATKALQVHDKLISWGIYDYDILENSKNDFGHTAFGPFVGNTSGTPHYCVCDGYAHAYQYALQQLGMDALVVCGMAGDAGADGGQGGHAWSMVAIDDMWYEVDCCWDDHTDTLASVLAQYGSSSAEYYYYSEMFNDTAFAYRLNHFMYRLMTAEIQNYKAPDNLVYTTKDGRYRLRMAGDSVRTRWCDYAETKTTFQGLESALFPIADGKLISSGETGETGWEDDWEEDYSLIAGTYYISGFNGYGQDVLSWYYGANYYKSLMMFTLNEDGTGSLNQNGMTYGFDYFYDGDCLYLYAENGGGGLILEYSDGDFLWFDFTGNTYTFSKLN